MSDPGRADRHGPDAGADEVTTRLAPAAGTGPWLGAAVGPTTSVGTVVTVDDLGPHDGPGPDGSVPGDDLSAELAAVAGRRWWNAWTVCLAALVLLLAGFVVGARVDRAYRTSTPAGNGSAAAQRGGFGAAGTARGGGAGQPAQGGQAGQPAGGGQTGQPVTGTVKLVDGTTLYVQTADGTVVTVRTGGDTAVTLARAGTLKDLKAGDQVTVQGTGSGDTVQASAVTGRAGG